MKLQQYICNACGHSNLFVDRPDKCPKCGGTMRHYTEPSPITKDKPEAQ